jgi:hypothetical protein
MVSQPARRGGVRRAGAAGRTFPDEAHSTLKFVQMRLEAILGLHDLQDRQLAMCVSLAYRS